MTDPEGRGDVALGAPRIRPYTTTNGRTEPEAPLDIASQVRDTGRYQPEMFPLDHADVLASLSGNAISVAEVAVCMRRPVMVVKVLLSDLIASGAVAARAIPVEPHDISLLKRLYDGLQNL